MVSLPAKTPELILKHCMGCSTNEEAVDKLKTNTDLFIQFFKTASEDSSWISGNQPLVEKMVSHLDTLSQNGHLRLDQARAARLTAQVAAKIIDSKEIKEFAEDDVTIKVTGGEVKVSHALLFSESNYFTRLFTGGFKEAASKTVTFPDMDIKTATLLKDFLETGKLPELTEEDVANLIQACDQYKLPDVADHLAKNYLTPDNLIPLVSLAYTTKSETVRDLCFKFIEKNFEGIKISTSGFNDMTVSIDKYSEDLKVLTPFFQYFNPDVVKANVPPDFALSVNIGRNALPREKAKILTASSEIFKMLSFARSVNLRGAASLVDEAVIPMAENCPHVKFLNLSGCSKITDTSLQAIGKGIGDRLIALQLDGLPLISDGGIIPLAVSCPNLQALSFGGSERVTDKSLEAMAGNLKKIENLEISSTPGITSEGLSRVVSSLPLKSLAVTEHPKQVKAAALITSELLTHIAKERSDINQLNFKFSSILGPSPRVLNEGFAAISSACKQLTALELSSYLDYEPVLPFALNNEVLRGLIQNNPELARISVGNNLNDETLSLLSQSCPKLQAINLIQCPVSNDAFIKLSERCGQLEEVRLGWNYSIDNEGFKKLVDNCPKIHSLSIEICSGVNHTALEYAIEKLPLVKLSLTPPEMGFEMDDFGTNAPVNVFLRSKTLSLIGEHCPNLKHLHINRRYDAAPVNDALQDLAKGCSNLETFYIKANGLEASAINELLKNNKNLTSLSVVKSDETEENLSVGVDREALITHPSLSELTIVDSCEEPTGRELAKEADNVKITINKEEF